MTSAPDQDQDEASGAPRALFAPHQAGRLAVQGWLASRLVLLIVALVLVRSQGFTLATALNRWDVVHFIAVSQHGYTDLTQTAFFPGLPVLLAAFSWLGVPPLVTGVLVSLAGSGMAAWALYRIAGGSVRGTVAVWAWSFAPMAVFTFVPYTEAIFCAFAFWAFWQARRDRWALAAVLAGAACAFRVSGVFLIAALGLMALVGRPGTDAPDAPSTRPTWASRLIRVLWLAIPAAVVAAYMIFLKLRFGSWTTWFQAQVEGWDRGFRWPWVALDQTLGAAGLIGDAHYATAVMFRWELAALVVGVVVTVWCLARKKIPEGAWVGIQVVALTCQVWVISLARSMVLWFPLFVAWGGLGAGVASPGSNTARRVLLAIGFCVEAVAMIWWASRFFCGAWAG